MGQKKIIKISDYEIIENLGEGLTSCVYKAIKKSHRWRVEQTVALKILKSRDQVHAFAQEVQVLSRLDSLYCVKLLGWLEHEKKPVLVLEHLEGVTLHDLINEFSLSGELIDEIVAQVQEGLRDLHQHGLRHGDLGPKNIFVTTKGGIKLLDFGFSRQNRAMGCTPAYLSPEGWRGEPLTIESDLFSLGLLREEIQSGEVVCTKHEAESRAISSFNKNSLLAAEPQQRQMLSVATNSDLRAQLAGKVVYLQKKRQANVLRTTVLHNHRRSWKSGPLVSAFLFSLFLVFYAQALHPSIPLLAKKHSQSRWRLDVRSFHWAEITLYKKHQNKKVLLHKQYTPMIHKNLAPGFYEIYWSSLSRSGVISVQLNKNRRILIP
ncbi:serine/threonine protein kinase [bacterium]|nr:serine/threonine protein kinase [bacterium]